MKKMRAFIMGLVLFIVTTKVNASAGAKVSHDFTALSKAFEAFDRKAELKALQSAVNVYDAIRHCVRLRVLHLNGACPIRALTSYFEKWPMLSEGNCELYFYLTSEIKQRKDKSVPLYQRFLQKIFLARDVSGNKSKLAAILPSDIHYRIKEFLSPLNPDNPMLMYPPLQQAIDANNGNEVVRLHQAGCDFELFDSEGRSSFKRALSLGKLECVKAMINIGIPGLKKMLSECVGYAHRHKQKVICDYLEQQVFPKLQKDSTDFAQSSESLFETVNILRCLNSGIDPNTRTERKQLPLVWAIMHNKNIFTRLLLTYGADSNATSIVNGLPSSCLFMAMVKKDPHALHLLLTFKADPNVVFDNEPALVLALALDKNNDEMALDMLKHKADPNVKYDFEGQKHPLLRMAVKQKRRQVVASLLEHKANVSDKDSFWNLLKELAASDTHLDQLLKSVNTE